VGSSGCAVVYEQVGVTARLAQLGLREEQLQEAIMEGVVAQRNCTENDPPTLRNILPWGKTMTGLRNRLLPTGGWRRCDVGNFSRVINDELGVAICVSTGDEKTGLRLPGEAPRTKYPKGTFTANAIESNLSFSFMADLMPTQFEEATVVPEGLATYMLLIARMGNEVRCELSLPNAVDTDGRVHEWAERIILNPVKLDIEPTQPTPEASMENAPAVEIDVTRKG